MNYIKLIDKLVHELSFRVGIPNVKDKEQQSIMSEILSEWGNLDEKKIIMEFLTNEADSKKKFDGYTHIGAGSYVKDSQVDNDGKAKAGAQKYKSDGKSLTAMSDDEYDKIKGNQGEKGKEAAADSDQNQQGGEDGNKTEPDVEEPSSALDASTPGGLEYIKSLSKDDPAYIAAVEAGHITDDGSDKKSEPKPKDTTTKPNVEKVKKLEQIDSVNEFNTNPKFAEDGVSDEDFKSNENIVPTTQQLDFDGNDYFGENKKFPKKYEKVLKRLLNTKKSKDISITDFTDAAGGGTLSSTAGEILTTLVIAIDDDEKANELLDKIEAHVKATKNESILDIGWIKSARQVREATKRRYNRMFGEGNWELETMAWDIEEEVQGLGLQDYKKNKGFSTDTYAKVKVNGESKLDEISLKKSKAANLLNTTTNRVDDIFFKGSAPQEELDEKESLEVEYNTISGKKDKESVQRKKEILNRITELHNKYNNQIPEDARVEVTKEKQVKIHTEGLEKNGQSIREGYQKYSKISQEERDSAFRELELKMGQNFSPKQRKQFEDVFAQLTPPITITQLKEINKTVGLGTNSRSVQKTSVMIHGMCKIIGNPAGETYDKLVDNSHTHATAVAKSILENENARNGLLNSIREDFPLKSLMTGEENMALGDLSADKQTLSEVFGVSDFNELQENLKVRETPPPPSIVYWVEGDEPIPVSIINTRPDGIGYGGTWKLEMKVHPEFANRIKAAQNKLES